LIPKKKKKVPRSGAQNNAAMTMVCQIAGLPIPKHEQMLVPGRKWRVDLFWPQWGLVIEIEGGIWTGGRHVRPAGFRADIEKYNAITLQGYTIFRILPEWIDNGKALALLQDWLGKKAFPTDGTEQ
jgi:very-short-patch-repair endonuclease